LQQLKIYASAHIHVVGRVCVKVGTTPFDIDAGFEVAPGEDIDIS
jgi:hypothetical protein